MKQIRLKEIIRKIKNNNTKNFISVSLLAVLLVMICLLQIINTQAFYNYKYSNFNSGNFNNINEYTIAYSQNIEILGTAFFNPETGAITTNSQEFNKLQSQGVNLSEYEGAVLNLINTVRVSNGLAALQPNQSLIDIARTRSNDMLQRGYFSHYSPEGKNVFNIMKECGITFKAAGENLAHSKPASIGSPEAFLNAWMNSPSHAANILRSQYGIIGVGMVENGDRRVVTTVFRNP